MIKIRLIAIMTYVIWLGSYWTILNFCHTCIMASAPTAFRLKDSAKIISSTALKLLGYVVKSCIKVMFKSPSWITTIDR